MQKELQRLCKRGWIVGYMVVLGGMLEVTHHLRTVRGGCSVLRGPSLHRRPDLNVELSLRLDVDKCHKRAQHSQSEYL